MQKLFTYLLFAALLAGCNDEYTLIIPATEGQVQDYYLGDISTIPSTSPPSLHISENGHYLASVTLSDGPSQVKIIDVQSGQVISDFPLRSVTGEGFMGGNVQISNDGKALLVYTYNNTPGIPAFTAAIINPIEKKLIVKGIRNSTAVLYPDGKSLLYYYDLDKEIVEVSIPDTIILKKFSFKSTVDAGMLQAHDRNIFLAVERVISGTNSIEEFHISLWHYATNTKLSQATVPVRRGGGLRGYTFKTSKDMSLLALQYLVSNSINTKAYRHQLEIFNTFTGQSIRTFPLVASGVWAYDIAPSGRNFIVQEFDTTANSFKKPAIFSVSAGSRIWELPLNQTTIPQFATLAFSSDEKYVYGAYKELNTNQWRLRIWPVKL